MPFDANLPKLECPRILTWICIEVESLKVLPQAILFGFLCDFASKLYLKFVIQHKMPKWCFYRPFVTFIRGAYENTIIGIYVKSH